VVITAPEDTGDAGAVTEASLQPKKPGVWQVLVLVGCGEVVVGAGAGLGVVMMVEVEEDEVVVVVVGSLHPNQPGVLHVDVNEELLLLVELLELEVVVVADVVDDSSRHPHHPGVLHVSVLVLVELVVVLVVVVEGSVPLLSKNFQSTQSWQSTSVSALGTVSYFSMTSLITLVILCVPTPTLQPRSPTVSYIIVIPV